MTTGEIPTLNATTQRAQPDTRSKRREVGAADWGLKNRHNPRAITTAERLRSLRRPGGGGSVGGDPMTVSGQVSGDQAVALANRQNLEVLLAIFAALDEACGRSWRTLYPDAPTAILNLCIHPGEST